MANHAERRFKNLMKNSDPKKIHENLLHYTLKALIDTYNNNEEGTKNLDNSIKLISENLHHHPDTISDALGEITVHWLLMCTKANHESAKRLNLVYEFNLLYSLGVEYHLNKYKSDGNIKHLECAQGLTSNLIKFNSKDMDYEYAVSQIPKIKKIFENLDNDYLIKMLENKLKDQK